MDTPERDSQQAKETPPPVPPVAPFRWEWGREEDRRPRLPWIGLFLVVYGALLLVQRLAPAYLTTTNLLVLAAGLAFLIAWFLRRGTFSLYAGAFLTASSVPGLVEGLGYHLGAGFGTLCYGVALLLIAIVRFTREGGIGWQTVIGGLMVALGASEMALPDAASLILPILLVMLGLMLVTRDLKRPQAPGLRTWRR